MLEVTIEAGMKLTALLGWLFSQRSLLSTAQAREGNFQVTVLPYVDMYYNNTKHPVSSEVRGFSTNIDGGQGFTL